MLTSGHHIVRTMDQYKPTMIEGPQPPGAMARTGADLPGATCAVVRPNQNRFVHGDRFGASDLLAENNRGPHHHDPSVNMQR